jgi:hypothetical protein
MNTLTVTLSDDLAQQLSTAAASSGQPVNELILGTIQRGLALADLAEAAPALANLSDSEVLAAADLEMPRAQNDRLSELLQAQQARPLAEAEQQELANLMEYYKAGLLYKGRALAEAVRRGLRTAPES